MVLGSSAIFCLWETICRERLVQSAFRVYSHSIPIYKILKNTRDFNSVFSNEFSSCQAAFLNSPFVYLWLTFFMVYTILI